MYVRVYFWVIHSIPLIHLVIFMPTLKGQHWKDWYLKVKLQYFDHLRRRSHSLEKTLMLGKIECRRRRGQQRMRWLDSITDSTDMNLSKLQEIAEDRGAGMLQSMGLPSWTRLSYWTRATIHFKYCFFSIVHVFLLPQTSTCVHTRIPPLALPEPSE